jgi:drug/metabolite transporter (DMT)-like permease
VLGDSLRSNLTLYVLVLIGWGASWIAIPAQLGVVAPEVSVFYRFAVSAVIMFAWMLASGRPMRFPLQAHLRFAALGMLCFSSNFAVFYYAGFGVVFATATVYNLVFSRLFFGDPIGGRAALAAAIGLSGLVLVFWPEIARQHMDGSAAIALLAALCGTCFFSLGNMVSRSNQKAGLPVLQANAWGMLYGSFWLLLIALVLGRPLAWDPRPVYAGALMFHVVFSTILAFGAYMTLLGRIGPQRAGYATVMFPIIALAISAFFEGYRFTPLAGVGVALILSGNLLVLTGPAPAARRA